MTKPLTVCTRCVMDTSDPNLEFDADGVCTYCRRFDAWTAPVNATATTSPALTEMMRTIKRSRGRYDCVIGLSGGVDSSYVALLAHEAGLRPLCVHFDNGWNTETAVDNIRRIVETYKFDLMTYVIDWTEFRDLQRAFLQAGVIDLEMLSDHAIFAAMYKLCRKQGIRHVLSGTNVATESGLPNAWIWPKMDWRNIKAIHRRFGEVRLKTFPHLPTWRWLLIKNLGVGVQWHEPLNAIRYEKHDAIERLKRETGWREYGGKHHESRITKFYQNYILPAKFGVDKRKSHLSALVRNGELTRDEALAALEEPLYDPAALRQDREFVRKKLGFTEEQFAAMMAAEPVPHDRYPSDQAFIQPVVRLVQRWRARRPRRA